MAAITLSSVSKRFAQSHVVKDVDLRIEAGEFAVFVGPSGCGKSTLLRMIAGLESVSGGHILIGDRDVTAMPASERGCAMVFQSYALYPHMTVEENLSFGMRMRGVAKNVIAEKLAHAIDMLQLAPYLARRPAELSGGQAQRVAIGRALVQDSDVFLLDEPLSNLDAELRLKMRIEIRALHRRIGKTMIYVTHDQVEAMTLADRIVVLRDGRVEQVGPPMTLYRQPANAFVAGFIGSPAMNMLTASANSDRSIRLRSGAIVGHRSDMPRDVSTLKVGVRPEHLVRHDEGPFKMNLHSVEALGAVTYAYGDCEGEAMCVALDEQQASQLNIGDTLRFSAEENSLHFFAADGAMQRL
ncbi:MAG: ABC transporter ATP-binding protein [Casimicrobium sp.]